MKSIIQFISKNKRSIFYSFVISIGIFFALSMYSEYGNKSYWRVIAIISIIFIFEIYLNWRFATKVLRQIDMPNINVYNLWGHLINHITLPLLLFYSFAGFLYFNQDEVVRYFSILLHFMINVILFVNIRSYYQDEFNIEEKTKYIYDLIKLIIFFLGVNLILHGVMLAEAQIWIGAFLLSLLALMLGLLLIYRKNQKEMLVIVYIIISTLLIGIVYILLFTLGFVLLGINLILFLLFYFILSFLHHKIERTLTPHVVLEYVLIFILALLLFHNLS